jgi:hypothetical protein
MGDSWPRDDTAEDLDPLDFTWGSDCGRMAPSEWCFYREPHEHGFACDRTCPCKTDQARWRSDA